MGVLSVLKVDLIMLIIEPNVSEIKTLGEGDEFVPFLYYLTGLVTGVEHAQWSCISVDFHALGLFLAPSDVKCYLSRAGSC